MRKYYDFIRDEGAQESLYQEFETAPVTMRLDRDTVTYFKSIAEEMGIPYQSLINFSLRDCAVHHRKLHMKWAS